MNKLAIVFALTLSVSAFAHDEGHGPKLTDGPKNGGVISPVIKESEEKLGPKATVVYKGELVRAEDGTVTLYLYDAAMKPLSLSAFNKEAKGILSYKKKKKWKNEKFEMALAGETFKGKAPVAPNKPFNVEVILNDGKESFLVAFENLD